VARGDSDEGAGAADTAGDDGGYVGDGLVSVGGFDAAEELARFRVCDRVDEMGMALVDAGEGHDQAAPVAAFGAADNDVGAAGEDHRHGAADVDADEDRVDGLTDAGSSGEGSHSSPVGLVSVAAVSMRAAASLSGFDAGKWARRSSMAPREASKRAC
jgi:hypothetical protein